MRPMLSVTLDPRLLAPPQSHEPAGNFRDYVTRLLSWSAFAREKGMVVTLSRNTATCLCEDGAFPLAEQLRKDMAAKGVEDYDLKTIKSFCERFFQMEPCFQAHTLIADILHDQAVFKPSCNPCTRLPKTTAEAEMCMITLALLAHCECPTADNGGFAVLPPAPATHVFVSAQLHALEHTRTDLQALSSLPQEIRGNVAVCSSLDEFVVGANESDFFREAETDDVLRLSIKLAIYRSPLERHLDPEWDDLPAFRIGTEFRERAQQVARLKDGLAGNLVRSIVDAIEDLNQGHTHALRTGEGGNNPQRTSGGFAAWRRDVSGDVHLHYWKGGSGLIGLAWISHPHNDFDIPQPSGK